MGEIYKCAESVLTRKDYAGLYGNLDKADEASEKAKFLFSAPDIRPQIEDIEIFAIDGGCKYEPAGTCSSIGQYSIISKDGTENYQCTWRIVSGDAEIISNPYETTVLIQTAESNVDVPFEVECKVVDDLSKQKILLASFVHTRAPV